LLREYLLSLVRYKGLQGRADVGLPSLSVNPSNRPRSVVNFQRRPLYP